MGGRSWIRWTPALLAVLVLILSGCGRDRIARLDDSVGRKEVAIEATSFDFQPAVIRARKGDTLVLKITNTSGRIHNFTIHDSRGGLLKSVDLAVGQTATVEIELKDLGAYEFHCDKLFHPTLGMKGRIDALP